MRTMRIAILSLLIMGLLMNLPAINQLSVRGMGVATSAAAAPLDEAVNVLVATENNDLVGFNINNPEEILSQVPITGLQEGEKINSLLLDPVFIENPPEGPLPLFAVTNQGRFYFINSETGEAARFGRLQLFIGEDFDATLSPFPSVTPSSILSPSGATDKISVATPTEIIEVFTDRDIDESTNFKYEEGDMNFGKEPCITSFTGNIAGPRDEAYTGFDKNQCALVKISRGENLGCMETLLDLTSFLAEHPEIGKPTDIEDVLLTIQSISVMVFAPLVSPPSNLQIPGPPSLSAEGLRVLESESLNEIFALTETGEEISLGAIRTDSPIRDVVFIRQIDLRLEPDFTIAAEQPTITLNRGEKLKNFTINITRTLGFAGNVTISRPDALPAKVKVKPASVSTTGDSVSFKKIKVKGAAEPGTYPLEFTATDETGRIRKTIVNLVIE